MGNWISVPAPSASSAWNQWRLYKCATQTGAFTLFQTNSLTVSAPVTTYYYEGGTSGEWYKYDFYDTNTTTASAQSDAFQATAISTYYTTPSNVAERLQFKNSQSVHQFDAQTNPTIFEVLKFIQRAEDMIDSATGHAWRTRYSAMDSGQATAADYEHLNQDVPYKKGSGYPFKLIHRKIKNPLSSAAGDALMVWNGTTDLDYLANYQEGRNKDWWMDYENGILYLIKGQFRGVDDAVKIKYRYGETPVPADIEEAATILAAAMVLDSDERSMVYPEGSDRSPIAEKISSMRARAKEIMANRTDVQF